MSSSPTRRWRVVPACALAPALTVLTCPAGHSTSPTLLSGTTPPPGGSSWAVLTPELGPTGTACTDRLSAAQLGPAMCSAPACVLEETATRHGYQPPGPVWRVAGAGRLLLPPPTVGAAGAGGAGGPGAARRGAGVSACARPQPRAPEAPTALGGHGGSPGALAAGPPCSLPVSASCAGCPAAPSPRLPPLSRRERTRTVTPSFQASPGLVGRAADASPRATCLTSHEGGEACSGSCRRAEPVPFPELSTVRGEAGSGLCFLLPAPHVPIFIRFLFVLPSHFVSNSRIPGKASFPF